MFILFSPFSFLFFTFYVMVLLFLFTTPNFYLFWVFMELMMLIFMGLSYTLFLNSFSPLMVYFLIQAFASFSLLIAYMWSSTLLFSIFVLFKLSMFPFHVWFLNVIYRFPNFLFWLASTLHKIPIFLMMIIFSINIESSLVWLSIFLSSLVAGILMLMTSDMRFILIASSVGNNSWMLLSSFLGMSTFFVFFTTYAIFLYFILSQLHYFSKPLNINLPSQSLFLFLLGIMSVSGLPPFPFFFAKLYVLSQYFYSFNDWSVMLILFLITNSFMMAGYFKSVTKYYVHVYNTPSVYTYLI